MNDLGVSGKILGITDDTVRETDAYRHQEIASGHSQVRSFCSMHSQHTCVVRILSRENAFSHKGICYRGLDLIGQFPYFFPGVRSHSAAAYEDKRLFRFVDHICRCLKIFLGDLFYRRLDRLRLDRGKPD